MFKISKIFALASLLFIGTAFAAEPTKQEINEKYVSLKDSFVTNYGGPGKLKYFTVKVSVQVSNANGRMAVEYHLPLIRNALTMYFSKQTDATVKSPTGQEKLRQGALKTVQDVLIKEVQSPVVEDILFSQLNYQE